MKQKEIPQDPSALDKFTKELCYAVNEQGEYVTQLSRGWQVKAEAMGIAWEEVQERLTSSLNRIKQGDASPILYFMELHLMDVAIVAAYTGYWRCTVKRHLHASVFQKLSDKKLMPYTRLFQITTNDLRHFSPTKTIASAQS